MKKLFTVLFLLLAVNIFTQEKIALIIGNGNYTSFGRLPNVLNDANDMKTALEGLGFNVEIVIDGNRGQMVEAIGRFKNRLSVSKNSYGFFFYAGHGLQYNGINYLIPSNADIPNANYLGDSSVSVQSMLSELNDAGNDLNIIVLDACRDFPAAWNRSMNRGLTVVSNQPADSIIVYSTSAGSVASDGTGRNGLFTGHLLRYLNTPELEVTEVFRLTGAAVAQSSDRQQIPAIYNQFFGRAFLGAQLEEQDVPVNIIVPLPASQTVQPPTPEIRPVPANTEQIEGIAFNRLINGAITTANPSITYPIIVLFPGMVSINITNDGSTRALPEKGADVIWFNASGTRINGSNGGFNFPYSESMHLNTGVYFIEINGLSGFGNTGTYNLRADYFTDEREPNNTRSNAQIMVPELTVKARITSQDTDMYRYELAQPGRLTVNITRDENVGIREMYVKWYNADGTEIRNSRARVGYSDGWPYNQFMDLEAGSYLIEITPYSSGHTGTYNLTIR